MIDGHGSARRPVSTFSNTMSPCLQTISKFAPLWIAAVALGAEDGGIAALRARLGALAPTGAGIGVIQVEAPAQIGGQTTDFAPDLALQDFSGKSVILVNSPNTVSWHSTNVAQRLYGSSMSLSPGVASAWVNGLFNWLPDMLKLGTGQPPAALPSTSARVMNHSWAATYGAGNESVDREAIRRLDFWMTRDGILAVYGENNGAGSARRPMMGDCFNGISVGRLDLQHSAGVTGSASDTPGRMKPEIIAPGNFTSMATPLVGSAAVALAETLTGAEFSGLSNTQRAQLTKSALLGGADRTAMWGNNAPVDGSQRGVATMPLDAIRGSGELDVDRAHRIITGGRTNGATSATVAANATPEGWGTVTLAANGKQYWRFRLHQEAPALDFTLVWPRGVSSGFNSYTYANLNVRLQRSLNGGADMIPLEGEAGLATFVSGNVSSVSGVDNVETIHLTGLRPGEYTLEVSRADSASGSVMGYASWIVDDAAFGLEGDVDANGVVDFGDVALALLSFGGDEPASDMDVNGLVDFGDVALILLNFG
jgi:hypothetical protein